MESTLHAYALRDCSLVMPLWLNVMHLSAREDFLVDYVKHWLSFKMSENVGWSMEVEW